MVVKDTEIVALTGVAVIEVSMVVVHIAGSIGGHQQKEVFGVHMKKGFQ